MSPENRLVASQAFGRYKYVTNCTNSSLNGEHGQAITKMKEKAKIIDYDDFEKAVGRRQLSEIFSMYDWSSRPTSFALKDDWAVGYYKSIWRGIPCVFLDHSRIEYVFTLDGKLPIKR